MTSRQEINRQSIQQLWDQGIREGVEIHRRTDIALNTIYDNIRKLKRSGTIKRIEGSGRPRKIEANASRALAQYIQRDSSISTRTLATRLSSSIVDISYRTVGRYLVRSVYRKSLPRAMLMLTDNHKHRHVKWAQNHLNDDWENMLFSDETAFQLFQNTVECWHKGQLPTCPMPKD